MFSVLQCSILLGVFSSFILVSLITKRVDVDNPMSEMIDAIAGGEYYMVTNDPHKVIQVF